MEGDIDPISKLLTKLNCSGHSTKSTPFEETETVALPDIEDGVLQMMMVEEYREAGTRDFAREPNLQRRSPEPGMFDPVTVTRTPPLSLPLRGIMSTIRISSSK
jgi:hypothetical protein